MHDQHDSPSQRPSQDYGPQDFLHLGEDLEQRERERAQATEAPADAESWLFGGPEPVPEDGAPASPLPGAVPADGRTGTGWLMEAGDGDAPPPDGAPASGEAAARRLEATYLEPESSSEVIGRSLHRSLLPAASVLLVTVAAIGAWKLSDSGPSSSSEPAPIEFKAPQRPQLLVPPTLDGAVARQNGDAATPAVSSSGAPPRQPVVAPSEPSELSVRPTDTEEDLADPFELSEGPGRSAAADPPPGAPPESLATPVPQPVSQAVSQPVTGEGLSAVPVAALVPLGDPGAGEGPARASLLPPAAWAMPVALSSWARSGALASEPREVEEIAAPVGVPIEPPFDVVAPVAPVVVADVDAESGEAPAAVDPVDVWLAGEGTVPFSALGRPEAGDPVADLVEPSEDEPTALFVPTEPGPDAEPDVVPDAPDTAATPALVADGETERAAAEPWQDEFWADYDASTSWSEYVAVDEPAVDDAEAHADEVASAEEPVVEPASEQGEVAALEVEDALEDQVFPWDEIAPLVDEPVVDSADQVASVEEPAAEPVVEPTPEVDEVVAMEVEDTVEAEVFPWDEIEPQVDEPVVVAQDEVATGVEPVMEPAPEADEPTVVASDTTPEAGVELPEFEPLEVLDELPVDEELLAADVVEEPTADVLPALDDEATPEIWVGVVDPPVADDDPLAESELRISEEIASLAEDAARPVAEDEDPVAGLEENFVALPPDAEVPEELVDSVDGEWFLGGPVHGPVVPDTWIALEADEAPADEAATDEAATDEAGPSGEAVANEDPVEAKPRSSLLGNGDLFTSYGDFLRSGRVPHGASPDLVVGTSEPVEDVGEEVAFDPTDVVPERNGLARADSRQRWDSVEVPDHLFDSEERVYTPLVGDVRIELVGGDLIEGQLHSLGTGRVWVDSRAGRMQIEADRVLAVLRLGTAGEVALSDPDERDYSNLPHVRVRTAGGTIIGRQLARDGSSVTVLTDAGIRMTLQATDVEPANPRRSVVGLRPR